MRGARSRSRSSTRSSQTFRSAMSALLKHNHHAPPSTNVWDKVVFIFILGVYAIRSILYFLCKCWNPCNLQVFLFHDLCRALKLQRKSYTKGVQNIISHSFCGTSNIIKTRSLSASRLIDERDGHAPPFCSLTGLYSKRFHTVMLICHWSYVIMVLCNKYNAFHSDKTFSLQWSYARLLWNNNVMKKGMKSEANFNVALLIKVLVIKHRVY